MSVTVPPMAFLAACVVALLLQGRLRRLGRLLSVAGTLGLLVAALPLTAKALLASLEDGLRLTPPDDAPPGAVVVLGADVVEGDLLPLGIEIGRLTLDRLRAGAAIARRTGLPILVSGGVVDPGTVPVGVLMARSLSDDFGLQARWVEARSGDTWQNAEFSAAMLHAAGIGSVYLVSHAWHLRRALIAFRHFGIVATAAPPLLDRPPSFLPIEFVPRTTAWTLTYYGLHEWIGCAVYALRA